MKFKERVISQIEHQETDFIPYARLGFEDGVAERVDDYYGSEDWRSLVERYNHIKALPGAERDGVQVHEEDGLRYDVFGSKWRIDARPFHLEEPGLKEPCLTDYQFPSAEDFFPRDWRKKALAEAGEKEDYFLVGYFGFGLFERSWAIRGFNQVLTDSIANPDFYEELLDEITELQLGKIDRLLDLPIDGLMFSDDWGHQNGVLLGPARWREFLKPRLEKMYDRVHQAGKYTLSHCCGDVEAIIPDLIEIGLDVLQSVQPEVMDPYVLKEGYGEEITFWGGLGSQRTIPFGTPEEIRTEVKKLCRIMGEEGGYILGPAKSIQPETPIENAVAVIEAFLREEGKESLLPK